ncbi:MAG: hydantoinase B/oxoprolinase family protein, partial [Planctomycetota bacterium]
MTSGGNLVAAESFSGRDSILSGPAGGVVALGRIAEHCDASPAVGLDMGGTSTDVSRFDGRCGRRYESQVAGLRVMTPMMDIHTIAAGGGSICDVRDGRFCVGPQSAGSDPGPASYGRGGPLAVTDLNLLLGRLPATRFPFPLRPDAARQRLSEIAGRANHPLSKLESLAEGFLQIAVTQMAEAVRTVSTSQGIDVRDMSLVGFGGAAGAHLCQVADALQISRIIDHPDASMLSALGMGLADEGSVCTRGIYRSISDEAFSWDQLAPQLDQLKQQARTDLAETLRQSDATEEIDLYLEAEMRIVGTDAALSLPFDPVESITQRFHELHQQTFGYRRDDAAIECVALRCEASHQSTAALTQPADEHPVVESAAKVWRCGQWMTYRLWERSGLRAGQTIESPALIVSDHSTLIVDPGWQGEVIRGGIIQLHRESSEASDASETVVSIDGKPDVDPTEDPRGNDPVLLELVARRLQGIADIMGEVLRRTSISVNVKERRDYSCAVFRSSGELVANAPHVPVHLGAMGHTVRHLRKVFPQMAPGDCYLSNDPYAGGSHLPDLTLVTPVFCSQTHSEGTPDFFVASRAHHAEIGGMTPGSMPPQATNLAEEGIVIRNFALVRHGVSHLDDLRSQLLSGPYPSRDVSQNLADVMAQQAAGQAGVIALTSLSREYSVSLIDTLMKKLLGVAGDAVAHWITKIPEQASSFCDQLDDGTTIRVTTQVIPSSHASLAGRLSIDFSGTSGVHPRGFNATPAIVTAAVLYVLRVVAGVDLPLCDGVLRDIDLHLPEGLLNPPPGDSAKECAAVVAGNVETSQRIVDCLLGSLGVAAASQGTMNNVLVGDESFGYYETICGGSGATPLHDGADAVHTHMTNTRITDPEVLEARLPIRLNRFAIRHGSGGEGLRHGGNGIIREWEFLRPLVVSLLTNRRTTQPYGMRGGKPGQSGENEWIHDGKSIKLPSVTMIHVHPGDRLILKTPGGGGFGDPSTPLKT